MFYILLAHGFEEIEAFGTVDFLRRCGLEVKIASVEGVRSITGAHGITVLTDCLVRQFNVIQSQGLILPGGMPGAEKLRDSMLVKKTVMAMAKRNKLVAAICAAPMVLGVTGVLKDMRATCYPGFEPYLKGAIIEDALVVEDENFITAKGPGATIDFAAAIARRFVSEKTVENIKRGMIVGE